MAQAVRYNALIYIFWQTTIHTLQITLTWIVHRVWWTAGATASMVSTASRTCRFIHVSIIGATHCCNRIMMMIRWGLNGWTTGYYVVQMWGMIWAHMTIVWSSSYNNILFWIFLFFFLVRCRKKKKETTKDKIRKYKMKWNFMANDNSHTHTHNTHIERSGIILRNPIRKERTMHTRNTANIINFCCCLMCIELRSKCFWCPFEKLNFIRINEI